MNTAKTRATHDTSCGPACPHWGDLFTGHGTTEAFELKPYRVLVMQNKWDSDEGRFIIEVRASGPNDAKNQAMEQVKEQYPDACWLSTVAG